MILSVSRRYDSFCTHLCLYEHLVHVTRGNDYDIYIALYAGASPRRSHIPEQHTGCVVVGPCRTSPRLLDPTAWAEQHFYIMHPISWPRHARQQRTNCAAAPAVCWQHDQHFLQGHLSYQTHACVPPGVNPGPTADRPDGRTDMYGTSDVCVFNRCESLVLINVNAFSNDCMSITNPEFRREYDCLRASWGKSARGSKIRTGGPADVAPEVATYPVTNAKLKLLQLCYVELHPAETTGGLGNYQGHSTRLGATDRKNLLHPPPSVEWAHYTTQPLSMRPEIPYHPAAAHSLDKSGPLIEGRVNMAAGHDRFYPGEPP